MTTLRSLPHWKVSSPDVSHVLWVTIVAAAYIGAAEAGFALAFATKQVTAIWPPAGIALAAFLLRGNKIWPGVFIGAFVSNAMSHEPVYTAAGIAVGNTLGPLFGAYLLRRFVEIDIGLSRLRDVMGLALLGAPLAMLLTATNGVLNLVLGGIIPWTAGPSVWWVWWVGDSMGALLVAPTLLTWYANPYPVWPSARLLEFAAALAALVPVSALCFSASLPLAYPVFPIVIWVALRFEQRETAIAVLIASAVAVWQTIQDQGPFVSGSLDRRLGLLVTFMAVLAITGLALGAVAKERRRAEASLRRANDELEERVLARTTALARANAELTSINAELEARTAELDRDVTKRKNAEKRFRELLESAPDAIVIVDANGRIVIINTQTEKLFGYARDELLGKPVEVLMPARSRAMHTEHRVEYVAGPRVREMGSGLELYGVRKDGTEFPIEISLGPLQTEEGLLVSSAIRDITARKRVETARQLAEASNRAKSDFLSNMSHELRTPLNAIIGFGQMLEMDHERTLTATQKDYCQYLLRGGNHLLELVSEVLDLAGIESGRLKLSIESVNVRDALENVYAAMLPLARNAGVNLKISMPTIITEIAADEFRLRQVLINLVSNGIKYNRKMET
jgi:PAS domain S-box-containing protein